MTYLFDDKIRYDDSPNLDAFGSLRTSVARLLGEYRYMYGSGATVQFNDLLANSGTLTADYVNNCFYADVTTASGSRAVRQTKQYHPYIPATSNKFMMTFKMDTAKANLVQAVGAFDDNDGIFFRMNGTTPEMVIRRNGVDAEVVPQSQWNKDRLDGSMTEFNQSGVTADFTKCQIFVCDFQWLGVGRVRVGFATDGSFTIVHEFSHANRSTETYMKQPSLPLRWEIKNTGTTASASRLQMICGAVYCEGADAETGFSRSVSTDGTVITVSNATEGQLVLAIRLKNTLVGKQNHSLARLKNWVILATNDVQYKLVVLNDATKINGTPTWNAVPGYGWCEYTKNAAMVTGWATANDYNVIHDGFATGANGAGSGSNVVTGSENINNAIYQNYDSTNSQILALVAYKLATNADVKASFSWLEVK